MLSSGTGVFTSYEQALNFLYEALPMYQRVGVAAYKKDLSNTLKLCEMLGNPQERFKSIHVAGTNGKGSSAHMIAAILQTAGYKTGLYTSPHLKSFTERIKINGKEASANFVLDFLNRYHTDLEVIQPSFFEMTVAMAFDYFACEKVDIAVIEVGLGGRLDSTNVILPQVSLITNISLDHQHLLGNDLKSIAGEKAGIIKPFVPVVISEHQLEIAEVFKQTAESKDAPLYFAQDEYEIEKVGEDHNQVELKVYHRSDQARWKVAIPLQGDYQLRNVPGVLMTIALLRKQGYEIGREQVKQGLYEFTSITGLKGRWQILGKDPLIICDTGHNLAAVQNLVQQLRSARQGKLHIVWGMVNDKDVRKILALLPPEAKYYFCEPDMPRALPAVELQQKATLMGLKGGIHPKVPDALHQAICHASPDDLIFIGGSTFVVAEIPSL